MATATLSPADKKAKQVSQSYWSLVWWKFKKNRIAVIGGIILLTMYVLICLFAEFVAPYDLERRSSYTEAPPITIRFIDDQGKFSIQPFVYQYERKVDQAIRRRTFVENPAVKYPVSLFVKGDSYKLWGFIPGDIHLFGLKTDDPKAAMFLMGSDSAGRDYFSRIIYGGRLSLLIGLIGQILTLVLGSVLGAISGYYGGAVDMFVQRFTEFLAAFPDIPLFMALAAAIPQYFSPIIVYFMLTLILALVRWGGLARQVRGLILSLREREYVLAAKSAGASDSRIMFRHLLPGTMSHVIVIATLSIPGMILAETSLSWLGLGLRPPLTSWGVLLQEAATVYAIRFAPWLLWTVPFIILVILAFNMLGDGLRDALDPYGGR
ncbi:MAG: ABC transporter permease [Anaerolineae bacterium]|nr:ABC transporter permease [Anaerolineae bacterium]